MPRSNETLRLRLAKIVQHNANLFTGIVAFIILVLGIVLVQAPSKIGVAGLSLLALATLVFLFFNGRAFLKATLAVVLLCVCADYGFRFGTTADTSGKWGVFWLLSLVLLWSVCLSITYFRPSLTNRWIVLAIFPVFHFLISVWLMLVSKSVGLSLAVALPVTLLAFLLVYYLPTLVRATRMLPKPSKGVFSDDFVNSVLDAGWGAWRRDLKVGQVLVIWNENSAYQLVQMPLDQAFSFKKRLRRTYLSYRNRNANAGLFELVRKATPFSGVANADIMTIILDKVNANGPRPRTIGIGIPDTKKRIPVGIMPARNFFKAKNVAETLNKVDTSFSSFTTQLTERQTLALDSHLPMDTEPQEWSVNDTAVEMATPDDGDTEVNDDASVENAEVEGGDTEAAAPVPETATPVEPVTEAVETFTGAHAVRPPRKPQPSKKSRKNRSRNQ